MLYPYLRNGEMFLKNLNIREITEETVKEYYLEPIMSMLAESKEVATEGDALNVLKAAGFEVSATTKSILDAFMKRSKGVCSICGKEGEIVENRAFIYPFERKIDSLVRENNRLAFCLEHAFKLYSAMAYLYIVPLGGKEKLKFFFDAEEKYFKRITHLFKNFWRERLSIESSKYFDVRFSIKPYNPHEAFFLTIHEFVKFLRRRGMIQEAIDVEKMVRVFLVYGSGQFYGSTIIEGTKLASLTKFFVTLQKSGKEIKMKKRTIQKEDSAVALFYERLEVPRGKDRKKNFIEREKFTIQLLNGKFDFVTLNKILMERRKEELPFPAYYLTWVRAYYEAFGGGGVDLETFEKVNGMGYSLGMKIRGTNLDRYLWEIFRARGFEEFVNKLVELQAKLETTLDLRPFYENEREWKVLKAILLNGMLNALYKEEGKENEGD
ncbi:hypothetical protein [Pyrococcus sp. ST04]|uniref:hypothetical protein n=1 Tax=Pyrococcus sp. ST04 TaxID=1183377 RepID=UPI0002605919|nr:hypothetical protein [Pyrococcus sp. ST04]AFK21706.1 hypothetical protein Py04_0100 [Pyrococcus sp. ST04]